MMKKTAAILSLFFWPAASEVLVLTTENYEAATMGKSVFLKFFAPWCGHCRSMADDWEQLAGDWASHPVGLVAEVDCTTDEGRPLCEDFEVQGFPTLLWGDPMSPETYEGEREYEPMSEFAKKNISKPICSAFRPDNCSPEDAKILQELKAKSKAELEEMSSNTEAMLAGAERVFDAEVEKLQKQYDEFVDGFNGRMDAIKTQAHYKFVEQTIVLINKAAAEAGVGAGDEL